MVSMKPIRALAVGILAVLFLSPSMAQNAATPNPAFTLPPHPGMAGMYGSMGGVYSPDHRPFRLPRVTGFGPRHGMFGSMAGVYGPYDRPDRPPRATSYGPRQSMFGSMAGVYGPQDRPDRLYHLPTMTGMSGMFGSMGNVYGPYLR